MKSIHAGGVAVAALWLCAGCGSKPAGEPAVEVPVQATVVRTGAISEIVTGDAVLSPRAQAALSPRITAPVRKLYVQRGSHVRAGQLLAVLDNRDLRAAALDSQGSYDQAQAAYSSTTRAAIPEDYQKVKLDLDTATTNLTLAQRVYDSRLNLFQQGAIPGRDVDTAKSNLVQAQSAFDIAKAHFESQKAFGRQDAVKTAKGQLVSAEGKYQGAEAQLSFSEIHSPIAGVVTDRPLYAGETAPAGTPLITVMDTSSLIARTHLPQQEASRLRVGEGATLQVPGFEQPVAGKVSVVSPALDPGSTTLEVWVEAPNPTGKLKAGTPVHVAITSETAPDAVIIPKEAMTKAPDGKTTVMVIGADSVAHTREVQTGIVQGDDVQVVSGLKPGEKIVSVGAYAMADGTKVKVTEPGQSAEADSQKPDAAKPAQSEKD